MASISVGKAGFGCQRLFRCLGTVLTAMERSDAERVSPFDSMLVSPCRGRGHAVTFASHSAQVGASRRPPSWRLLPCLSRLEEAAQTLRLDRRRSEKRDPRQPRRGAGQPGELHHIGDAVDTNVVAWLAAGPVADQLQGTSVAAAWSSIVSAHGPAGTSPYSGCNGFCGTVQGARLPRPQARL